MYMHTQAHRLQIFIDFLKVGLSPHTLMIVNNVLHACQSFFFNAFTRMHQTCKTRIHVRARTLLMYILRRPTHAPARQHQTCCVGGNYYVHEHCLFFGLHLCSFIRRRIKPVTHRWNGQSIKCCSRCVYYSPGAII